MPPCTREALSSTHLPDQILQPAAPPQKVAFGVAPRLRAPALRGEQGSTSPNAGARGRSALVSMDVVIQNHSRCKSARGAPLRALQHCCTRGEPQLPAHGAKSNRNQDPNKPKPHPQASEMPSLGAQQPQLTLPPAPSKAVCRLHYLFSFFLLSLVSKSITRPRQQLQGTGRMLGLLSGQGLGHRHHTRGARAPQPHHHIKWVTQAATLQHPLSSSKAPNPPKCLSFICFPLLPPSSTFSSLCAEPRGQSSALCAITLTRADSNCSHLGAGGQPEPPPRSSGGSGSASKPPLLPARQLSAPWGAPEGEGLSSGPLSLCPQLFPSSP